MPKIYLHGCNYYLPKYNCKINKYYTRCGGWDRKRESLLVFALFIAGNFVPAQILMIPVRNLTLNLGVYDTKMGLILFHTAFQTGFCTFFLRGFIKELPHELVESARIEGASEFSVYWNIILPLVLPALAALAVLEFTFIWNDYFWALVLVQGDEARPISPWAFRTSEEDGRHHGTSFLLDQSWPHSLR